MPESTTMTIRVSRQLKERLGRLAHDTRLKRSPFLAAAAVSAHVDRELEIIDGIRRGLADVKAGVNAGVNAGRVVSHGDAMDEIDAAIEGALEAAHGRKP